MGANRGKQVQATLQEMEVHDSWSRGYRTPENEPFYGIAFDYLATVYGAPETAPVLDAGCGSSTKSIQLAHRGYNVVGVDLSEQILEIGRKAVVGQGLSDLVTCRCANLTNLSFPDETFDRVLCWGVLMHVPEVEKAIEELCRVARPGATIVISEGNAWSMEAVVVRWLKRLLGLQRAELRRTPAGIECWEETPTGTLLTRQADVRWLIRTFAVHGVNLVERRAGQFSELFTMLRWKPARQLIHAFNSLWFRKIRIAGPARANLLVFRKQG